MIYRGAAVDKLAEGEFETEEVRGHNQHVVHMDMDEKYVMQDHRAKAVESLPGEILRREEVPITGGFTHNLGNAIHFGTGAQQLSGVLFLNEHNIREDLSTIEYTYDYFNDHPGVLSWVDTLSDGELRVGGDLIALLDQSVATNQYTIQKYRDQLDHYVQTPTYAEEAELFANALRVDISDAVVALGSYYETDGVSGNRPKDVLDALDGYSTRSFGNGMYIGDLDMEEKFIHLWDETHKRLPDPSIEVTLVAIEDHHEVGKSDTGIGRENFEFVYDGKDFIYDYDLAGVFVG
jgi:hypothetical protein